MQFQNQWGEGMNKTYGYVRVSTREQNEDRQMIALRDFPVLPENIYLDKLSGKDFNRPEYQKLLRRLKKKDILVIKSIDRLGRNYKEILDQWRYLTKSKEIYIVVLDMPLLDTRKSNDLIGTLIADIVLQLLSYVAETERENIKQRQAEGIAAAKARGVKFGRPNKKDPHNFYKVYSRWRYGKISGREAARQLGVSYTTFMKWAGYAERSSDRIKK